jgi:hypothetical protein
MSNPTSIQSFLDTQTSYLLVVEEVLNEWSGEGCLQFPNLMGTVTVKMGWEGKEGEKIARAKEPIIREYVRTHPDWHVTRGAHGGIMRASEKQKKEDARLAKEKARAELNAAIEAELVRKKAEAAAQQAATPAVAAADNTNTASE